MSSFLFPLFPAVGLLTSQSGLLTSFWGVTVPNVTLELHVRHEKAQKCAQRHTWDARWPHQCP